MGSGSRWVLAHILELYSAEISEGVHHVTGRAFCIDYLDERHGLGAEEGAHARPTRPEPEDAMRSLLGPRCCGERRGMSAGCLRSPLRRVCAPALFISLNRSSAFLRRARLNRFRG